MGGVKFFAYLCPRKEKRQAIPPYSHITQTSCKIRAPLKTTEIIIYHTSKFYSFQ